MKSRGASKVAVDKLGKRLKKAEAQIETVDRLKSKQTPEEQAVTNRLLKSARRLITSLRQDFDEGSYNGFVDDIATWQEDNKKDLKKLETLGGNRLTSVLTLRGDIESIMDAALEL